MTRGGTVLSRIRHLRIDLCSFDDLMATFTKPQELAFLSATVSTPFRYYAMQSLDITSLEVRNSKYRYLGKERG